MTIKLTNIYVREDPSLKNVAFHADLVINGGNAGKVENNGLGDSTLFEAKTEDGKRLIKEAEEWCKGLPPVVSKDIVMDDEPFSIPMSLELYVNEAMADHLKKLERRRNQKKMDVDMREGILYGTPDGGYQIIRFKVPIEMIIAKTAGIEMLGSLIQKKVLPLLKDGERILNTNLSRELLEKMHIPKERLMEGGAEGDEKRRSRESGGTGGKPGRKKKT